jgi:uncharacterized lipoprotein YmbA
MLALAPVLFAVILAGCAAPAQNHYYTLVPSAGQLAAQAAASGAFPGRQSDQNRHRSSKDKAGRYAISVQPVHLPEQVDTTQIVISERGSARVVPLNQSSWASPLGDEIRRALSAELSARLGVLDVSGSAVPKSLAVVQVYVTVNRFDSVFDSQAILDATWHLKPLNEAKADARICNAQITLPVAKGVPALVDGQREAVHKLAGLIASQIAGHGPAPAGDPAITLKGCV